MTTTASEGRRPYRSPLRQQQSAATRTAVLDAARSLFATRGWRGTGMRDVAAAAGVAQETIYAHFASKTGLLRAVVDRDAVGDELELPLARRREFLAIGKGERAARLTAAAQLVTSVNVRTATMARVLREAAPGSPEIAEMLSATRARQRQDVAAGLRLAIGREPTSAECDGVWALASPEVYLLLVEESGWTADQYRQWFEQMLERAVPLS